MWRADDDAERWIGMADDKNIYRLWGLFCPFLPPTKYAEMPGNVHDVRSDGNDGGSHDEIDVRR